MSCVFRIMERLQQEFDEPCVILQTTKDSLIVQISIFMGTEQIGIQYNMPNKLRKELDEDVDSYMDQQLTGMIKSLHESIVSEVPSEYTEGQRLHS